MPDPSAIDDQEYRWCYNAAYPYRKLVPIEDLMQVAQIGLLIAHRTYRSEAGLNFKWYAMRCIHREVLDHVRSSAHIIRKPRHAEAYSYAVIEPWHAIEPGFEGDCIALEMVDVLPEPQKTVIRMAIIGGMRYTDISLRLKKPISSINYWYKSGISILKKNFFKEEGSRATLIARVEKPCSKSKKHGLAKPGRTKCEACLRLSRNRYSAKKRDQKLTLDGDIAA